VHNKGKGVPKVRQRRTKKMQKGHKQKKKKEKKKENPKKKTHFLCFTNKQTETETARFI
jgi:hypothetical protein